MLLLELTEEMLTVCMELDLQLGPLTPPQQSSNSNYCQCAPHDIAHLSILKLICRPCKCVCSKMRRWRRRCWQLFWKT